MPTSQRCNYYERKNRVQGKREKANQHLLCAIVTVHEKYPAMGLDSIYHFLKPQYVASRARIHHLMVKINIHSVRTKIYKRYRTTTSNDFAPNLLNRNFITDAPNKVWVGDITYIQTKEGWLYLAIVKNLFTEKMLVTLFLLILILILFAMPLRWLFIAKQIMLI